MTTIDTRDQTPADPGPLRDELAEEKVYAVTDPREASPKRRAKALPPEYRCRACGFTTYSADCSEICPRCNGGMESTGVIRTEDPQAEGRPR